MKTILAFVCFVISVIIVVHAMKEELPPEAEAMKETVEWAVTYQGQHSVIKPVAIRPYSIGVGVTALEFTPATMPDHRCVFVSEPNESGLYCTSAYGGLSNVSR